MIALPGGDGLLVVARQTENGVALRKWALLTRTEDMTAIVVATLPETAREAYPDAALRAALGSVTVRAKFSPDEMLAVLPYRLDDLGGFRLLRASPDGTAVLTFGPNDTTLPAEQPYFMVAPRAVEPPPAAERDRFAQRVLAGFVNRPDLRIVRSEEDPHRRRARPRDRRGRPRSDDRRRTDDGAMAALRRGRGADVRRRTQGQLGRVLATHARAA